MDALVTLLKGIAPTLATAVAGPLGGAAVSAIASKLGVEDSVQAVAQAIAGDPQAAEKLQELELQWGRLDAEDRADAREREIKVATAPDAPLINKIVTPLLGLGVVAASFILLGLMIFVKMDSEQHTIVIYVLGAVNAATVQVLSYYFGASHDHKKDTNPSSMESKK